MAKIIVASDAEYRPARDAERARAVAAAVALAPSLSIEVATAEACAGWLERVVVVAGTHDARDPRTDSDEQRLVTFTRRAVALQATRDANAIKRGAAIGPR